ncbi:CDP-glycerol glycerophosphotransferase family protein [Bacillus sp. FJAT-53060]|uniref:CDP-glycerol glycerophosphotransferase family protein n=1 Tax=Bacillus TaxID=1386 RepID=UPI001CF9BF47|nr:CDP-glycerol glycerophosphotransferase family protein [Bacillus stratosphericus]
MSYASNKNGNIVLNGEFTDFNNGKVINRKKIMLFKKFYIYKTNQKVIKNKKTDNRIEILEIHENDNRIQGTVLVVYLDPLNTLSFIIIKKDHPLLTMEQIIEKAESNPPQRLKTITIGDNFYIFGVIRFKFANMKKIDIAIGYDKALNFNFKYFFSKNTREMFSNVTNKLGLFVHFGYVKIKKQELLDKYIQSSEINLPLYIKSTNKENLDYYYPLKFNYRNTYNVKHYVYSSSSYKLNENIEFFVRKSITGQMVLVMTDYISVVTKFKEKLAWLISRFGRQEKYDVYFEKFSKNAGESAFEVFKKSKAENDSFSKFILDKNHERFLSFKKQYGTNNILAHNSFKSFYYIFKAKRFISSDLVSHVQRRLYDNSQSIKRKILSNNNKVFLQHGVCLATNVFERGYFNKKVPICPDYIVTNSKLESYYFSKYPKFSDNQLIEKGVPNLDLYVKNRNTDKKQITFMLTWRPWDVTGKIEKNSYIDRYLQFLRIVKTDPFYEDKVINITLHPKAGLMLENQFPETYDQIKDYVYQGDIKDALINSKVVITDYSSICFYAFAGCSNIIFFWGDKEIAEQEYGAPNILQDNNRFGDVVYHIDSTLNNFIKRNYNQNQPQKYIDRYNKLVEHSNGNNTENVYNEIKKLG